jgi:hypothetical protein
MFEIDEKIQEEMVTVGSSQSVIVKDWRKEKIWRKTRIWEATTVQEQLGVTTD